MIHKIILKKQKGSGGDFEWRKDNLLRKTKILSVVRNNDTLL